MKKASYNLLRLKHIVYFSSYQKGKEASSYYIKKDVSNIIYSNKKDPSYVYRETKNICELLKTLISNIDNQQNLTQLLKLTRNVHISHYSSWNNLHDVSDRLNQVINSQTQLINKGNMFFSVCEILDKLNYQICPKNDKQFFQLSVIQILQQNAHEITKFQIFKNFEIISKQKSMFQSLDFYKKILQTQVLRRVKQVKINRQQQLCLSSLIKNGLYVNFWQESFLQQLLQNIKAFKHLKQGLQSSLMAIKLSNNKFCQNKQDEWSQSDTAQIALQSKEVYSVTQDKIQNILRELGYEIETGRALYNFQIDYKIEDRYLIQFHGIHHYTINHKNPVETIKSHWKMQSLQKRGYQMCIIPFYQWNKLQTIYQKKQWLVNRLQNTFLGFS